MKTRLWPLLLVASLAIAPAANPPTAPLPNILWLVAEDINPHLGCFGDTNAVTPNLDRFAASSLRYPNCWSAAPVCAPARTALISGVYPPTLGAEHMRSMVNLPEPMRMYPQILRDLGYYCVNNSKEDYNLQTTGKIWDESSNRAHWTNRPAGKPFFAALNFGGTHESQIRSRSGPLKHDPATIRIPAYHPDTPEVRRDWARYHDNITELDNWFAARLQELEAAGLADNTIVFFYGDNGSGMPRSKRWPYNSGLNVPLIVHVPKPLARLAPKDYQPGAATPRLVNFVDFAPTLVSIAGATPPSWMHGRPFMGAHPAEPPAYNFGFRGRMDERYDFVRSVRDERYIYIRNYLPHLIYGQHIAYMFETPTTRVWKGLYDVHKLQPPQTFFWEPKPAEELYDLQADPDEVRNLVASREHQPILQRLRAALRQHLVQTRDLGFLTEAERHRRAGLNAANLGQHTAEIPLPKILEAAERASLTNQPATKELAAGLKDPESAIRYWSVLGIMLRGPQSINSALPELRQALQDPSPSVRIAAARTLGLFSDTSTTAQPDDLAASLLVLQELAAPAKSGTFVALEALAVIEALGPKADSIKPALRTFARIDPSVPPRSQGYAGRFLDYLVGPQPQDTNTTTTPTPRKKRKN